MKITEKQRAKIMKEIKDFPFEFKMRIVSFVEADSESDYKDLGYEIGCCETALKLVEKFKTSENIVAFDKIEYEDQQKVIPNIGDHSGNSWKFSVRLAILYIEMPIRIIFEHGALSLLMGSKYFEGESESHFHFFRNIYSKTIKLNE